MVAVTEVIRIEIIIELDAVHSVFADYFRRSSGNQVADLGDARIKILAASRLYHPARLAPFGVGAVGIESFRHQHLAGIELDAVRIEPGVQLQAPLVGGGDSQLQKIVARILPLLTGEQMGEGEKLGGIKGVGKGTNLEKHRVQPKGADLIKHGRKAGSGRRFIEPLKSKL